MQKKVFEGISLTCYFQRKHRSDTYELNFGSLSGQADFRKLIFVENPRHRHPVFRNTKIYEGDYVSIVRRKDGRYYPLCKAIDTAELTDDKYDLAYRIYCEFIEALNVIE